MRHFCAITGLGERADGRLTERTARGGCRVGNGTRPLPASPPASGPRR